MKRTARRVISYRLRQPDPELQLALDFEPALAGQGELTIEERFRFFDRANPHVYEALREMALALAANGVRRISPKLLVEQLRARGTPTAHGVDPYQINNVFTSRYARRLAQEPALAGLIPMRKLVAE